MRIAELYSSLQGEGLLTGMPSVFVRASGCNLRCWFCDTPFTSWQPEGEDWAVDAIVDEVDRLRTAAQLPGSHRRDPSSQSLHSPDQSSRSLHSRDQWSRFARKQDARPTEESPSTIEHVVITGGEPMLFAEMLPLCEAFSARGLHITIETAGTMYLPVACNLMSISPKLASSTPAADTAGGWSVRHERSRHQPDVIHRLIAEYDYQLKFVVNRPGDLDEVTAWLTEFPQVERGRVLLMPQGVDPAALERIAEWLVPYCREAGLTFCPRKHIEWYGAARGT